MNVRATNSNDKTDGDEREFLTMLVYVAQHKHNSSNNKNNRQSE